MPGRDGPIIVCSIIPEGQPKERLDESHRILSLEFEDNDRKADKLTLTVENGDLRNFDDPLWKKGGIVVWQWGYENNLSVPREAVIQKVTGFQKLKVECLAKSILLHKDKRARKWTGLKRSQVVEKIATEWGYDAQHRDIEDTAIVCETIHQAGLTDAQLLTRLAKKEGFVWYIDHTGLHFHRRRFEGQPKKVLHWYADPGQGDVLAEPEIENDITARPGKVTVKARDPLKRTTVSESGSTSTTKHTTLASTVEVIDAQTATTARKNIVSTATVPSTATSQAAAKRAADARFLASSALVVKLKAPIIGDPQFTAKTIVEWRGLGKRLSGNYYVRQVNTHVEPGNAKQDAHFIRNGTAEYGGPRSGGKLNAQKGQAKTAKGAAAAGTDKAALQVEVINSVEGTTSTRWKK